MRTTIRGAGEMKHERKRTRKGVADLILIAVIAALLAACSSDPRMDALLQMEQPSELAPSPERIQELKETIAEYEEIVNQKVEAAHKQASYLKLLAQEYMRYELYGPALEALEKALLIESQNQVLHQLAGVCAGYLAKAQARPEVRAAYLVMAEQFYKMSLEIDPNYQDGLYALGTLYHFEMARHLDAIHVLESLLDRSPTHVPALFVLARAHAALGNVEDAVGAYDRIIENAADGDVAEQARRNRQLLMGGNE